MMHINLHNTLIGIITKHKNSRLIALHIQIDGRAQTAQRQSMPVSSISIHVTGSTIRRPDDLWRQTLYSFRN